MWGLVSLVVFLLVVWFWIRPQRRGNACSKALDCTTQKLLQSECTPSADKEAPAVAAFSKLLVSQPVTDNIEECAEQMRTLTRSGLLQYKAHVTDPDSILIVSRFAGTTDHAALMTRFTVQFNLYAGSVVALGSDEQREELYATQPSGSLGCFAFTEVGAGVMTGVRVDTTAEFDVNRDVFVFTSPSADARKNWISQGAVADRAVVLARLIVGSVDHGPHLFWVSLRSSTGALLPGIDISLVPTKNSLVSLDNAVIAFNGFESPRSALLSRFCSLDPTGKYTANMPKGCRRLLDLVLTRLLTGRLCLAEFSLTHALDLLRHNWRYCEQRRLFRGEHTMSQVLSNFFVDRARSLTVLLEFVAASRTVAADCIKAGLFSNAAVELASVSKFAATGYAADCVAALRKVMGSEALFTRSRLGIETDVFLATCFAEGDNAIMEQKVVLDTALGRTSRFPWKSIATVAPKAPYLVLQYVRLFAQATILGKSAQFESQLLRDIAWAKAHILILDQWFRSKSWSSAEALSFYQSYERILIRWPVPVVF